MEPDTNALKLRPMRRSEFDVLVGWAAAEGWNPGVHDADIFWNTDPEGFVAVEAEGAPIGMDGVFAMEPFYARGGFVREHRELRFEAAPARPRASRPEIAADGPHTATEVVALADVPIEDVIRFDAMHFPAPRAEFVRRWISQPGAVAAAALRGGSMAGMAVARPARTGMRIGPLFADSPSIAESLLSHILERCAGLPVHLDAPECNPDAMALVARHGMREIFGCAKMTLGTPPKLPWSRIYGVTSFELG